MIKMKLKDISRSLNAGFWQKGILSGSSPASSAAIFSALRWGKPRRTGLGTVMGNRNTLAVASLTDTACIVLAEGVSLDEGTLAKAEEEGIAVLSTDLAPPLTSRLKSIRQGLHDSALL